jgi:hypothetical protein
MKREERKARVTAPGLNWCKGAPYWRAGKAARAAGYPVKNVNLSSVPPEQLIGRCEALEAECAAWLAGERAVRRRYQYDGTLGSLLAVYQTHEDSPYHSLKAGSRIPYDHYLRKLTEVYGERRLKTLTGLDIKGWHKVWRAPREPGRPERLAAAHFALNVLKAALTFGLISGFPDCGRLREFCSALRLPGPAPRDQAPSVEEVERAIAAAHALGRHRAALCYALQFETTARQWDLLGQWAPLSDPRPSAVVDGDGKWFGPTWAAIDRNLTLTLTPSKTERTTKATVCVNLSLCPLVMTELALVPLEERVGPLIVNERTGLPYRQALWGMAWRDVKKHAGLPRELWNRDLRAGGITEAQKAGAASDDRAKLAGHSPRINRDVYSRDVLVASNRVAEARDRFRKGEKAG